MVNIKLKAQSVSPFISSYLPKRKYIMVMSNMVSINYLNLMSFLGKKFLITDFHMSNIGGLTTITYGFVEILAKVHETLYTIQKTMDTLLLFRPGLLVVIFFDISLGYRFSSVSLFLAASYLSNTAYQYNIRSDACHHVDCCSGFRIPETSLKRETYKAKNCFNRFPTDKYYYSDRKVGFGLRYSN